MKHESTTQYLRRRLHGEVGIHNRIARESGVPQTTVSRIYIGTTDNPTMRTVEKLLKWFDRQDALTPKRKPRAKRKPKATK